MERIGRLGKRAKCDFAVPESKRRLEDQDDASIENNTNFNWAMQNDQATVYEEQAIEILSKTKQGEQMPATQFYEQSLYFVDTLQQEFCHVVGENWLQFKEPVSIDSIEPCSGINEGKWTNEEHARFLEALRFFGKDWEKIERYVQTRTMKNIISHGQKFLIQLVKFLEGKRIRTTLTEEEVQYYHGILNKKMHSSTKQRLLKLEQTTLAERKIFEVTKERPQEASPQASGEKPKLFLVSSQKTPFCEWQAAHSTAERPLSFSLKAAQVDNEECVFSFKLEMYPAGDLQDGNSVDSQSKRHHTKFDLDDHFSEELIGNYELNLFISELLDRVLKAAERKGDLPRPDMLVIVQFGEGGPMFEFEFSITKRSALADLFYFTYNDFSSRLSSFFKKVLDQIHSLMDGLDEDYDPNAEPELTEIEDYVGELGITEEGREKIRQAEIILHYMTKEEWSRVHREQQSSAEARARAQERGTKIEQAEEAMEKWESRMSD